MEKIGIEMESRSKDRAGGRREVEREEGEGGRKGRRKREEG